MSSRFGRVALVLILAAAAAASAHQAITRAGAAGEAERKLAALAATHARADVALAELAAAERAYVAPGQGLEFWAAKVDDALITARAALGELQAPAAASRLDDFASMDQRAREYIARGQRALAADLIFADGYEILAAARTEAAAAASAAGSTVAASAKQNAQLHMAAVAGLGACALIAALLLLRGPKAAEPVVATVEPVSIPRVSGNQRETADDSIGAALDASLAGLSSTAAPAASVVAAPPPPAALPLVDLESAAEVCVDLGRLLDARDLQSVLSRIADVLEANGIIVWIADPAGHSLSPALTHGYPESLLARLGPLPTDQDTATSAAWRSRSTQVVGGALAVPMLTSEGCTGVLAVEVRNGRERASEVQSLARILAAQLAATVSSPAPEARRAAEA